MSEEFQDMFELPTEEEVFVPEKEQPARLSEEPMLVALMRRTVEKLWPDDTVMHDFVDYVLSLLSEELGHKAAKGGEFAVQHRSEGRVGVEHYALTRAYVPICSMTSYPLCIRGPIKFKEKVLWILETFMKF